MSEWPTEAALARAKQSLTRLNERAAETTNARRTPCSRCGALRSRHWHRADRGMYLCASCVANDRLESPDPEAVAMTDAEFAARLIAERATRPEGR